MFFLKKQWILSKTQLFCLKDKMVKRISASAGMSELCRNHILFLPYISLWGV